MFILRRTRHFTLLLNQVHTAHAESRELFADLFLIKPYIYLTKAPIYKIIPFWTWIPTCIHNKMFASNLSAIVLNAHSENAALD